MKEINFSLSNLKETKNFASTLAKSAKTGDIITFNGDLGVGKTSFIQFFIQSLTNKTLEITSPTFNLLHLHKLDECEIWHFDLYRIKNKEEIYELGIEDAFNYGISLIEWPDIINDILPKDRLEISISFGNNEYSRELNLKAYGSWQNKILLGLKISENE